MKATEWKCGLSTSVARMTREAFEGYARAGIACLEAASCTLGEDAEVDYKLLKKNAAETGVEIWSYHLPFCPFERVNIATLDGELRRASVDILKKSIDKASELEAKIAVIHPSGEPNRDEDRPELIKSAKDCLAVLAEYGEKHGVTVAVEDLPRTCLGNSSSDILELISADERLRACFDTNHLLGEDNVDFVKAVGNKIVTTHVSDYDFKNERHWLPYEGKNDWAGIVTALEAVGYAGPFLFEISMTAPSSISRRNIEYEDFYACYEACVNKRAFVPFGVPNEAECDRLAYIK